MTAWKLCKRAQHWDRILERPVGVVCLRRPRGWLTLLRSLALSLCVASAEAAQGAAGSPRGAGGSSRAAPGASTPGASGQASRTLEAMKSDLRRLVGANQVYHAQSGQYSTNVGALRGYRASAGVTVTILQASSTGWAAQATAQSLPGKSCVIAIGSISQPPTTMQDKHSGPEAVVACDNP